MELIKIENGIALLNEDTQKNIAEVETKMKELKEKQDELKQAILKEMESKNIIKLDSDNIAITYVAETYSETFDSKTFREENEELYNKFIKISPKKAYIKIKVK